MRTLRISRDGFSVLELFIATTIIIIIALTVVASFWRSQQRAIGAAALANLDKIRAAQIMFHTDNQTFTTVAAALQSYIPFVSNDAEWVYTIPSATGTTFRAVATRNAGRPFAGFTITLAVDASQAGAGVQTSSLAYSAGSGYPP